MRKNKKEELTDKDKLDLLIKAMTAIAALIAAIKS